MSPFSRTLVVAAVKARPLVQAIRGQNSLQQPRHRRRFRLLSDTPKTSNNASSSSGVTESESNVMANSSSREILQSSDATMTSGNTTTTTTTCQDFLRVRSGLLQTPRHGPGDAVITLNVGGKEFLTLRSTVASNEVLADCVARAECNQEFTHDGGKAVVFIDRDPTHFPLILNHLRNKVEGLSYYNSHNKHTTTRFAPSSLKTNSVYHVQLPKDIRSLRDVYVEASHFRIPELEAATCRANGAVTLLSALGGKGGNNNPFDVASKILLTLRRGLVALGSVGTIAIGSQQDLGKFMATLFPAWFSEEASGSEKGNSESSKSNSDDQQAQVAA